MQHLDTVEFFQSEQSIMARPMPEIEHEGCHEKAAQKPWPTHGPGTLSQPACPPTSRGFGLRAARRPEGTLPVVVWCLENTRGHTYRASPRSVLGLRNESSMTARPGKIA